MDNSEHVFFSGHGAGVFATAQGAETAEPSWFDTQKAYASYRRAAMREGDEPVPLEEKRGTVGCVAMDKEGHLAAATIHQRHDLQTSWPHWRRSHRGCRRGQTTRTCAISATGWGEYFIRTGVAQDIHGRMLHGKQSLQEACEATIFDEMGALGGDGGVIAVDAFGQVALVFNSIGMFRATAVKQGQAVAREVAMFGPYAR